MFYTMQKYANLIENRISSKRENFSIEEYCQYIDDFFVYLDDFLKERAICDTYDSDTQDDSLLLIKQFAYDILTDIEILKDTSFDESFVKGTLIEKKIKDFNDLLRISCFIGFNTDEYNQEEYTSEYIFENE